MEVGEEAPGFPLKPCGFGLFVFVPGHSHPLQGTLGGQGAPTLCAAGSEGDPSPEGRAAAVEYVDTPLLPSPHLLIYCSWPSIYIYGRGCRGGISTQAPLLPTVSGKHQEVSSIGACLSCVQLEVKITGLAVPGCSFGQGQRGDAIS